MDALLLQSQAARTLHGLRAACRDLRAITNARTRHMSPVPAGRFRCDCGTALTVVTHTAAPGRRRVRCIFHFPSASPGPSASRYHGMRNPAGPHHPLPRPHLLTHLPSRQTTSASQLRIPLDGGLQGALGRIPALFPNATTIEFVCSNWTFKDESLPACLAELPDGCWPSVAVVAIPLNAPAAALPTVAHISRLCPRLRKVSVWSRGNGSRAAAAIAADRAALRASGGLESRWATPRRDMYDTRPKLEALSWVGPGDAAAPGARGAPAALHTLKAWLHYDSGDEACEWLAAAAALPRLEAVELETDDYEVTYYEYPGDPDTAVHAPLSFNWLRPCANVTRLRLAIRDQAVLDELLEDVGRAAGGQLTHLDVVTAEPPHMAVADMDLLGALPRWFRRLESLRIGMVFPYREAARRAKRVMAAMRADLPQIAVECPALKEVVVTVPVPASEWFYPKLRPDPFTWTQPSS